MLLEHGSVSRPVKRKQSQKLSFTHRNLLYDSDVMNQWGKDAKMDS